MTCWAARQELPPSDGARPSLVILQGPSASHSIGDHVGPEKMRVSEDASSSSFYGTVEVQAERSPDSKPSAKRALSRGV